MITLDAGGSTAGTGDVQTITIDGRLLGLGATGDDAQTIAIDGRFLGLGGTPGATTDGTQMLQLVQQAMASAGVAAVTPAAQPLDVLAVGSKEGEDKKPFLDGRVVATASGVSGNGPTGQPAVLQYQDYQRLLSVHGSTLLSPVYSMKVEEAVELVKVNFESKSIEITGEVPITKIDSENVSPEKLGFRDTRNLGVRGKFVGGKEGGEGPGGPEGEAGKKEGLDVVEVALATADVVMKDAVVEDEKKEAENPVPGVHSSADLMSAELLLSLTRNSSSKEWPGTPNKSTPATSKNDVVAGASPGGASSGRKRKQRPIASAKPQGAVPQGEKKDAATPTSAKKRRVRKLKDNATTEGEQQKGKSLQHVSPEELLQILNIAPDPSAKSGGKGQAKYKGKLLKDSEEPMSAVSKASAKMEQLKASRVIKPMKEYVIETDSDSNSSSSTSSSSHFTPNSGSSSDSSSDSSSNDESSEPKVLKTLVKKVPGSAGRGRGRVKGRKLEERDGNRSSSSDDDSSSEEEEGEGKDERGVVLQRGRSKRGGASGGKSRSGDAVLLRGGHVVSIPTRFIKQKLKQGKLKLTLEVYLLEGCLGMPSHAELKLYT